MRVLMLTPDAQMIDRRILQEARTLIRAGYTVTLLAGFECAREEEYDLDGIHVRRLRYDGDDERLKRVRRFLPAPAPVKRFLTRALLFAARRLLTVPPFEHFLVRQGLRHPADVVHVHDLPALHAGVLLAETWGVPLVYDAHEIYYAQAGLSPRLQRAYFRKENRLVRRAAVVITVNDYLADLMRQRHGLETVHVLYNCAEPDPDFDPERERQRSPLRALLPRPGPILLYQGWISPERNIETLIQALVYIPPEARLVILGYGDHAGNLQQLASDLGLTQRVRFLGPVASCEMLRHTAGGDLGLIPYLPIDDNHRYCSPNKFFEYVQAGVPILAPDLPFFRQMAERHGVAALADFTAPQALGKAITALLHKGNLAEMRQRCLTARQVLTWSVEGDKLRGLYDRFRDRKTSPERQRRVA
jgi:glycosyltransferase involved in cell wall biosynthesis